MKSLSRFRQAHARIVAGQSAKPTQAVRFTTESKPSSYGELLRRPFVETEKLQNTDGTFKFLLGYDAPIDAPFG